MIGTRIIETLHFLTMDKSIENNTKMWYNTQKEEGGYEWNLTVIATIVCLIILITKMKILKNVVFAVRQIQKMSSKEIKIYYLSLFFIYIALCYNKKKNRKIKK